VYHIDRIVSASTVSADIMCVTADSAANTCRITQEIKGHSPLEHVPFDPFDTGEGWRGGRRETVT